MEARAVRERWPVPEGVRPAVMVRLSKTALDPSISSRDATQASRALLEADRLNFDAERMDEQRRLTDELIKLRMEREAERGGGASDVDPA
jgi:hypothetical protein